MKNLLLASTALVLTAGAAAAEVTVGGNGWMGVKYDGQEVTTAGGFVDNELNFVSRIRITFAATGETDGGLAFGGSVRADNAGGGANGVAGSIFVEGAYGKLSMGDLDGAAQKAIPGLPEIGFTDLSTTVGGDANGLGFITGNENDGPTALYEYSLGDLYFALSMTDGKVDMADPASATPDSKLIGGYSTTQEYAVGLKYTFGNYAVAAGYEKRDNPTAGAPSPTNTSLGFSAAFGNSTLTGYYSMFDADLPGDTGDYDRYGAGLTTVFGGVTVGALVQQMDMKAAGTTDVMIYGLTASYDLGGGAVIKGGIADDDGQICVTPTNCKDSQPVADLGIQFTF